MLRIKFPNGIVTADQLRTIGRLSVRYGRGMGDITTRQNIQLHWLRIEDMPVVLDELNAVGLSFTQACGDVWRNVVGCPLAGVDGHELLDSRPLIAELERTFVGDRRFSNLPRKFKVSVSGCLHRCAQHEINDIGLVAVEQRGRAGLRRLGRRRPGRVRPHGPAAGRVRAARGGGRGVRARSPRSSATRASAPSAHGRGSSSSWTSGGSSGCGPRSSARSAAACPRRSSPPTRSIRTATTWACTRSSRPGLYYLGATTLRGRFSGEQMIAVADIADRFGSGELRCTNRQNVIVLGVPDASVEEAAASLADIGLPTRRVHVPARRSSRAPGWSSASSPSSRPRSAPRELIEHLERRVGDVAGSLRINLNGCPNACAQYQVADIGLQGGIARLPDGRRVQGFILHIGGRLGEDAGFGRRVSSKPIPAEDAKYAVERLVRAYAAERPADGTFADWAQRAVRPAAGGPRRASRSRGSRPRRPPNEGWLGGHQAGAGEGSGRRRAGRAGARPGGSGAHARGRP